MYKEWTSSETSWEFESKVVERICIKLVIVFLLLWVGWFV